MTTTPRPRATLAELQTAATAALRRYLEKRETVDLKIVASRFIDAREHFYTREGEPDWLGRTYAYRRWVREVMSDAHVPGDDLSTVQAAVRYHSGNILRERLDAATLADLGLRSESPRERSIEKRERYSETLSLFAGGARIESAEEIQAAVAMMDAALRRISLASLAPKERRAAAGALRTLCKHAEEVAGSSS